VRHRPCTCGGGGGAVFESGTKNVYDNGDKNVIRLGDTTELLLLITTRRCTKLKSRGRFNTTET